MVSYCFWWDCEEGGLDQAMEREGRTYNQVADKDLENLGAQARPAFEDLLQQVDQKRAEGRADESTIGSHLGHTRREVVTILVAVLGQEGCNELLCSGQRASGQHLGAEGVLFELLDVGLLPGEWR